MTATYTKLRSGAWGARITGEVPKIGQRITITKKSGETQERVVSSIVWEGSDKSIGKPAAIVALAEESRSRSSGGGRNRGRSGASCACTDGCCDRGCRCDRSCNCRGGPIWNC